VWYTSSDSYEKTYFWKQIWLHIRRSNLQKENKDEKW